MRKGLFVWGIAFYINFLFSPLPACSETPSADIDISPEIINNSPVLQRWRRKIPNVLSDIKNDPSFRTRVKLGYVNYPSNGQISGVLIGVEDIFLGKSGLTISSEYQTSFNGDRQSFGTDLHYYLRPLGSYINIAPTVGYRYLETNDYTKSGVNLGAKLLLVLSRGGAADISLAQSWVEPGSGRDVGLTTLSVGYAVTRRLRISTDIQRQSAREGKDSRVGVVLEWIP
ncbi:hypothetical protein [Calothrix sp. 336/3]|uniref:hypothetical protein n=1 Tax=Calothrix sp. 336/3 TaxID=1337936 RepID=UPI0004E329C0|nr:hypothetical protein [Calothrix sp. 336/3]AKG20032.1 hypothetical protein IJ00_00760 [Calothrix sp. 336/3]